MERRRTSGIKTFAGLFMLGVTAASCTAPPRDFGTGGAGGSSSSSGASSGSQLTVAASVAACVNESLLDPMGCEQTTGLGQMNVDQSDSATGMPNYSFVRFDLDNTLSGKAVDAVTLELVATSSSKAPSDHSGVVYQVSSFTPQSLGMSLPTKVGGAPAGADQGAVIQLQTVKWSLPVSIVAPNAGVFLGIYPLSDDGVNYWNTDGASPPKLIIQAH